LKMIFTNSGSMSDIKKQSKMTLATLRQGGAPFATTLATHRTTS
jgi:hypothetical protein